MRCIEMLKSQDLQGSRLINRNMRCIEMLYLLAINRYTWD